MPTLVLKPGREKSLLRRHPWVFSNAIDRQEGHPALGETVEIISAEGAFLARAAYSPNSQIRARVWSFDPDEDIDGQFFRQRIETALSTRSTWQTRDGTDAQRLIHAESDRLPGLIVDRYASLLVLQSLSAGAEYWKQTIASQLRELTGLNSIYERSDADVRALEGLPPICGMLAETGDAGQDTRQPLVTQITEHGLRYQVDIAAGHKTGFYLDQRVNRFRVRSLAAGREVLDCFCYSGGFSTNALAGDAKSVLSVDASADALELCRENVSANNLPLSRHSLLQGDVFQVLRKFRDEARSFDLIILDPPKFAPTYSQAEKASRGYKDINLLAFKLLRPGGFLVTFSCSGGIDAALFQKIVAAAALDAAVDAQILEYLSQAPDHPVALNFPEGAYLKGLICQKH